MEILAGPLDWTATDEENLSKFLDTESGKRFIPRLLENAPTLFDKGDINAILIRSGEVRGYQIFVREILALAHSNKSDAPAKVGDYPSLIDDKAWNDGQKIEQQETP